MPMHRGTSAGWTAGCVIGLGTGSMFPVSGRREASCFWPWGVGCGVGVTKHTHRLVTMDADPRLKNKHFAEL